MSLLFGVVYRFSGFPSDPCFLRQNTCFTCQNTVLPWFLFAVLRAVHDCGRGGYLGWRGGVLGLVRIFKWAYSLTYQPDSQLQIPVRFPFPQETKDPSSTDHLLIEPHNSDCDSTIYPPPYLWKGFFHFYLPWIDSAMNRINCKSKTRASLPRITSTDRTNG